MSDINKRRDSFLEAVDRVLTASASSREGVGADLLRGYITAFIRRSTDGELVGQTAGGAVTEAGSMLAFAQTRTGDEIKVRAFNPTQATHGYDSDFTVLETCMVDQPFLLDTLRLCLKDLGLREHRCNHPILDVSRDAAGRLVSLGAEGAVKESWMHFEVERIEDEARIAELAREAHARLNRSRVAVADYRKTLRRLTAAANNLLLVGAEQTHTREEIDEISAFLTWLMQDNFIFLGFEELGVEKQADGELGLVPTGIQLGLRRPELLEEPWPALPSAVEGWRSSRALLMVAKDDRQSVVHRSGKLDTILVRQLDENGELVAIQLLTGLLTYKAVTEEGGKIPLLRRRLEQLLKIEEAVDGSHDWKAIIAAFNSLPVEYLFYSDVAALRQAVHLIRAAEVRRQAQVFLRVTPNGRSAFLLLSMPTEGWDDNLRQDLEDRLSAALGATYQDVRQTFGEHDNVVATFFVTADKPFNDVVVPDIERELLALTQTWDEKFANRLLERVKASVYDGLHRRYLEGLPRGYKLVTSPEEAVEDILALERLHVSRDLQFRVSTDGEKSRTVKLKIYELENIFLSDSLPILANFGLKVIDQSSTPIPTPDGATYVMDTFRVTASDPSVDLLARAEDLAIALRAVLSRTMEDDLLNRLVLEAALTAREVDALRAYVSCARQIESHFPLEYTRRVWTHHTTAARLLIDLLKTKFDPDLRVPAGQERAALVEACQEKFRTYLQRVDNAAEDRVLRAVFSLVEATVRINYFRLPVRPYISFKLNSSQVVYMPSPRPFREIFVHHSLVEGVHLRGGPIARGGIRWSDRFDDYRTEVLGLMRTQMVKNTVIVPVGSKGGFVLKKAYATREEERAQADEMYKTFISGLLDLTDNLVDGKVAPPDRVVRYDDDDPYLVVAADKGTAHLSDTANALSKSYGFWLGDAFASGGSVGYDHKKEAITARGAWECTTRHFNEMGIDPEKDVITATGIGDMSGDVFGNGLLLSRTIKLLAVFNHMHIFFDPDPDPERSFVERERLFKLPRSTWDDYDRAVISEGGGIYRRTAKAIPLSPQVKAMLGTDADTLTGDEAVRAILKLKVDLLWNGGIGTYVKATYETDRDVGDRVNDPVRINAPEVGAKVIGEGGNLGLTRAARIELGRLGGRLNTDFVDNSAGVDMSDHEVNLKLLFGLLTRNGTMSMEDRNALLKKLTDEVSVAVLQDNISQSRAISLDQIRSRKNLTPFISLIDDLDKSGVARREAENLPSPAHLQDMLKAGTALSRPELATLLAFTKMRVYGWLLAEERFSGDMIRRALYSYFPAEVRERFADTILAHPLRKEITATVLTTRIVDNAGVTFFQEVWEDTSFSVPEVAMAYLIASEMLGAPRLQASLAELEGKVSAQVLYEAYISIGDALEALTRRMLRRGFDVFQPDAVINRYSADFRELHFTLVDVLPQVSLQEVMAKRDGYIAAGLPEGLSQELATFPHLVSAGDIAILTEEGGLDLPTVAWLYHAVGEEIHARSAAEISRVSGPVDRWEKTALHMLRGKLIDAQYAVTLNIARSHQKGRPAKEAFDRYFADRKALAQRARAIESRILASKASGLAPATVLADVIGSLAS